MVENQACVVTGASRGIGRGIAEELASHGSTANCVAPGFVASEEASYMTGQILAVNGGTEW